MGIKLVPLTSTSQRATEQSVSDFLQGFIGEGAEAFPGDLTAPTPELFTKASQAFEEAFSGNIGDLSNTAIQDLISGKPAFTFDPSATTKMWEETFATPVMQSFRENVLPSVRESFNLPGVTYSRAGAKGVSDATSNFYGQYIAPTLFNALQTGEQRGFESAEQAAARRHGALGIPGRPR